MEPAELLATLRLLVGLLVPCVALLGLLSGLLLLRRRRLVRPLRGSPTPLRRSLSGGPGGSAGLGPAQPCPCPCPCPCGRPRVPPARGSASAATSSSVPSSHRPRRPLPAPPNSPASFSSSSLWAAKGIPDGAFGGQRPSTQRKGPSCRPAFPTRLHPSAFEYGSSIQHGDKWTQLSSVNVTASQGPGLDSDFGASAGVSLRILSSDSEESPTAPLLQSGRFEWDYYDPSYKKSPPLQRHLPCICSKQYWL